MEAEGGYNAAGLSARKCPFTVVGLKECPHSFKMSEGVPMNKELMDELAPLLESELFRLVKPSYKKERKEKIVYVEVNSLSGMMAMNMLLMMGSPNYPEATMGRKKAQLRQSNLAAPMVRGVIASDMRDLQDIIMTAQHGHGQLILTGERIPYGNYTHVMSFTSLSQEIEDLIFKYGNPEIYHHLGRQILFQQLMETP